MRAAVQVGYGDLESSVQLGEMPMPEPGPGDVVVRVGGTTVNRKDLFALVNLTGPGIRQRPPLPHINGTDTWGTVAAAGADVRDWREGTRVLVYPGLYCGRCEWCLRGETSACLSYGVIGEQCWGSQAEFVRVPAKNLEAIPEGLSADARACAGGSWLTAWHALVTVARLAPGETLLIAGASGGVGSAAIAIGRLAGAQVIAVVGSEWKIARAKAAGADAVVQNTDALAEDVRAATGGRGADVALDCVGGAGWRHTINALARFGRMAICGATDGDSPAISIREIYQQHRRILGAPLGTRAEFRDLIACLASGRLTPLVHATVPLVRIHDGLRLLQDRQCFGKVAVQVEGTS